MDLEIPKVPDYLIENIQVEYGEPIGMCYSFNRPISSYYSSYLDLLFYFITICSDSIPSYCLSRELDGKDYLHIYLHSVSVVDANEPAVVKGQILVTVYSHSYQVIGRPTGIADFVRTAVPSKKMGDIAIPWALQTGPYN